MVMALSPSGRRDRALIVSSGLHGVEGPFGSAVQVAALPHLAALHESGMRVVLIHALNPYGFAWGRRVDAANVDLNRAFRWDGMPESRPSASFPPAQRFELALTRLAPLAATWSRIDRRVYSPWNERRFVPAPSSRYRKERRRC